MTKLKTLAAIFTVALLTLTACNSPKLAPGGAYTTTYTNAAGAVVTSGDLTLYSSDSAFDLAWRTLDTVFLFERNNRQYLWNLSPSIKHTIDQMRGTAQQVVLEYTAARTAYLANPTPVGLTGVQAVLAKLQQLTFSATAALGAANGSITNAVPAGALIENPTH